MSDYLWTKHQRTVAKNHAMLEGKEALLRTWEWTAEQGGVVDREYMRRLKKEIYGLRMRLYSMGSPTAAYGGDGD